MLLNLFRRVNDGLISHSFRHEKQVLTISFHYRQPTELRKGNLFSHVFLSFCLLVRSLVTITHDALDLTVQGPPSSPSFPQTSDLGPPQLHPPAPATLLLTSGGHHWRPGQTCPLEDLPISLGATSGRSHWSTYDLQRAVCILLECFLDNNIFFTRMHSTRMRTIHCSGRLSCHDTPAMHTSAMHTHCHACPSCHACPKMSDACPLPWMPPLPHMPPLPRMHPLPHMPPLPCMPSSGSSGRIRGGWETWNLCGCLRRPSFLWLIFTGPGGGHGPPWIRYWCPPLHHTPFTMHAPPLWTEWQTLVKTLLSRNYCCGR